MSTNPLDLPNTPLKDDSVTWRIAGFNGICYAIALLWIGASLFVSLRVKRIESGGKEYHDFSQFYMGGLIARHQAWGDLYPVPHAGSVNSPGEWEESDSRPGYRKLAAEAGVPEQQSRYIQPPPFALMLEPVAFLKYSAAKKAWNLFMVLCAWGVAVMAGKSYELAARRRSPVAGAMTLLVAVSPAMLDTLRLMNVTPFIAALIGISVFLLICRRGEGGAVALFVGATSKYAGAVLLPLYIAMRKWRALIVMAIVAAATLGAAVAVMGTGPFGVFIKEMLPTFGRTHTDSWNRSLPALLMHLADPGAAKPAALHGVWLWGLRAVQWGSLAGILAVMFVKKVEFCDSAHVMAGAAGLMCWFLIFSPILWDHYLMYLSPLLGWVAWEGRRSWASIVPAAFVIVYPCLPDFVLERHVTKSITLAGPHECGMLATVVVMLGFAVLRLATPVQREEAGSHERRTTFTFTKVAFNRACAGLAALWLLLAVPAVITHSPRWEASGSRVMKVLGQWNVDKGDFPQFYMGGVMARLQAWDALYPVPNPKSHNNAGMPEDSTMRPRYAAEAERRGVGDRLRFIQPPPVALLLMPLGYLSFARAFQLWTLLLIACAWGLAVLTGRVYQTLRGRPTRIAGLIVLAVAVSPLVMHAIIIANMTLMVALCIAAAVVGLLHRRDVVPSAAIVLGGITKYATLALLPVAFVMRRWALLAWSLGFTAVLLGGSYAVMKMGPFTTYRTQIAPTLSRVHDIDTNQSILGLLSRWPTKREEVPKTVRWGVVGVEAIALAGLLWILVRRPAKFWEEPAHVLAGATALLTFLLIFSPVFWEHYPVYLCPAWAWLLWEGRRSWMFRLLGLVAIGLMYVPFTFLFEWREPIKTHILAGAIVMLGLAVWKLAATPGIREDVREGPKPLTPVNPAPLSGQ